jgi:quercetin dioxygenase-like cupin family protein
MSKTVLKKIKPLIIKLKGNAKFRRLLKGRPQTLGFRAGLVNLKRGHQIGEHTTSAKEELIVVLSGRAEISFSGYPALTAKVDSLVYIPAYTKHNVSNIGTGTLRYVYMVTPLKC